MQLILQISFYASPTPKFLLFLQSLQILGRNPAQQYPQRHGRIRLCATLCKKKTNKLFFLPFFGGQLKIKFAVGSMLDWLKSFRNTRKQNVQNGSLEQQEENSLQTRDCIRGNLVFIANRVGFCFRPPLAAYFNLQLRREIKVRTTGPTNYGLFFE